MSYDKLVDSAQLGADLTSVANAVRAKSGGSSPLAFPAGFVSEIEAIETGGRIPMYGDYIFANDPGADFPDKLYFENHVDGALFRPLVRYSAINKTFDVDIKGENVSGGGASAWNPGGTGAIRKLTCDETPGMLLKFTNGSQLFRNQQKLEEIHPALDWSAAPSDWSRVWDGWAGELLTTVRCKPNHSSVSYGFERSSLLSDASVVSIANAAKAGVSGKTITLHATPKARCSSILGTVSSVTDDTGTYDFFTADANGTVTLTQFITNTKGWTLA